MSVVLELELSSQQYIQLTTVAQARQIDLTAAAQTAVTEWLERELRLAQARLLMRELGAGLGAGQAHDASRKHDEYLYGLKVT